MIGDKQRLALAENQVQVWRTRLDRQAAERQRLEGCLSEDERQRAGRFRFPVDRERFVVARAELRRILGAYLRTEPELLKFAYNEYGKPALLHPAAGRKLSFNLSHSQNIAIYGLTLERDIGVDVEWQRSDLDYDEIARSYFSLSERAQLRALPAGRKAAAFFAGWARKEAFIKAKGLGVSYPLDQFSVCLDPGRHTDLLRSCDEPGEAERWSLRALSFDRDYAAAVCVAGAGWSLQCADWGAPLT
jgi:4'-phosphopantetheinyl transferase